jgi:DNA-binding response OmpR family regulator
VATARTSAEALARADADRPEVILLDISLGRENGLELIPQLRTTANAIVVLSLHDRSTHETAALASGADAYVGKADMAAELLPAIARALAARQALAGSAG